MPIPIPDQRIYNEYIPKMLLQQCGRECCLILHGPHNVRQFCTIPAVTGIDHRVFQRGKVLQHNSGRGKILASNNNLFYAIFFISAKESFLRVDPNAVENMAADILGNATVGITQVFILGGLVRGTSAYTVRLDKLQPALRRLPLHRIYCEWGGL